MKHTITYYYRGMIERGNGKPGYDWREGYSERGENGGVIYPWHTKAECRREARALGRMARFERSK